MKEKLKGHAIKEPPAAEAGDAPGVLAVDSVEDDANQCYTLPGTVTGNSGGKAAREAREVAIDRDGKEGAATLSQRL